MKAYTLSGSPSIPALGGRPGTEQAYWRAQFVMSTSIITTVVPHFTAGGIEAQRDQVTCPRLYRGFPVAQLVKNPPAMRETWIRPLGWEDPLEKEKASHSSILA